MRWQATDIERSPRTKTVVNQLSEEDFKEYLRLKDDKEKLEKAEEIFSKIIVLMLYDIGVKISNPVKEAFLRPKDEITSLSFDTTTKTFDTRGVNKVAVMPNAQVPVVSTKSLDEVSDVSEVDKIVEAQQMDPNKIPITNFQPATAKSLQVLEGQFEGLMRPLDGKQEIRVEIDLSMQQRVPPSGVYALRMYRGADLFSNSRGNGNLSNFQSVGEVPSLWIAEGGGDYRFQIFYFSRLQIWKANVYHKSDSNKWVLYSRFDLNKL